MWGGKNGVPPGGGGPEQPGAGPGAPDPGGPGHEERLRILRMVEAGKLSPAEAVQLLEALEQGAAGPTMRGPMRGRGPGGMRGPRPRMAVDAGMAAGGAPARWVRLRVHDLRTGRPRLNLNLPLRLVGVALGMAERFSSYGLGEELDLAAILDGIRTGAHGKLVDLEDEEEGVRLEILVE